MEINQLTKMVQSTDTDPELDQRFALADQRAARVTRHDRKHGDDVNTIANKVADGVSQRFPQLLNDESRLVVMPLAAKLHDNGYADSTEDRTGASPASGKNSAKDDHAITGARWAHGYLTRKGFPQHVVDRVCRIIINHRSSRVLSSKLDDPAWAIVVIADKCVGDEDRVRAWPAFWLRLTSFFGLARLLPFDIHNRVNFAIKSADVEVINPNPSIVRQEACIVLSLSIDERVAAPKDIYDLYHSRFHSCAKAAKYLGYAFYLSFNGKRYAYSEALKDWQVTEPKP